MTKRLLPLSCLLLASACQHIGNTPDGNPAKDIPAGTYVHITLQDIRNPERRSTYLVDPRTDTVVERRDGKRASAAEASVTASKAAPAPTSNVSLAMSVNCRITKTAREGCVDLAIDPKHETSGDPNPIKEESRRIALTERYVKQLAVNVLQTARRTGVRVQVPAGKAAAR
ncbi:hypothetical protein HUW63_15040 [Myxococcus sp. AM001]|uniref:hypothetical protein n=1 Tax=Myxococcus vastator TaxID=2709664 RepID=UPI0013D1D1F6|nr:hypothetical protein [Myxococcus vastator]NVJ06548.1 hypothetical protein [Myxococcus sp. AM001]